MIILTNINVPDFDEIIDVDAFLPSSDDNIEDVDIDHEIIARPPSAPLPVNTESDDEEVESLTQSTSDTFRIKLTPLPKIAGPNGWEKFKKTKEIMNALPLMSPPDFKLPFVLCTDASNIPAKKKSEKNFFEN